MQPNSGQHRRVRAGHATDAGGPRSGAAAAEFAVCLPLVVLITFGAIEAANGIYLKQIVTQAAYEGARVASTAGQTQLEAAAFCQQVLDARGVRDGTISIQPLITSQTAAGTTITVSVQAPANSNAYAPLWYFRDSTVEARVVMVRN